MNAKMSERPIPSPFIVPPSGGKVLSTFGDEITVHLGAAETGGKYTMFTDVTPPGGGPPPHYHLNEDEWFFVLEGRAEFSWTMFGPKCRQARLYSCRGAWHMHSGIRATSRASVDQMAPSGFEVFFARCAEEFAKPGPPDMARIVDISAEHGIHYVKA